MEFALPPVDFADVSLNDIATPALFKSIVSAFPFPEVPAPAAGDEDEDQSVPFMAFDKFDMPADLLDRSLSSGASSAASSTEDMYDTQSLYSRSSSPTASLFAEDAAALPHPAATTTAAPRKRRASASHKLERLLPKPLAQKMKSHVIARGRRRAKQLAAMSEEEKLAEAVLIREKNRLSAKECRQRKKTFIQTLEARVAELEDADRRNQAMIAQLQQLNANLLADLKSLAQ